MEDLLKWESRGVGLAFRPDTRDWQYKGPNGLTLTVKPHGDKFYAFVDPYDDLEIHGFGTSGFGYSVTEAMEAADKACEVLLVELTKSLAPWKT